MKVRRFSLFIVMSTILPNLVRLTIESRKKRILYGQQGWEKDRDYYQSFRYYVFLARWPPGWRSVDENPDTYRFWKVTRWFQRRGPKSERLHCGGALITPKVVQTACHCVSYFSRRPKKNSGYIFNHARAMNVWEDRVYTYVGANEVENMPWTMLVPKHYVVYEQCKQFIHLAFDVMDFGLIITEDSVVKRVPTAAISYAPVYKAADILKYYYKNIQAERVCLVIGHGNWFASHVEDSVPFVQNLASSVQRWGWRTVMNSKDCESSTFDQDDRAMIMQQFHVDFDIVQESTWVCLQHSNKESKRYLYLFGQGDSGGPVTCDNAYFAVVSMIQDDISMAGPIAHTTFENAAEFRDNFMRWIDRFETDKEGESVNHITDRIFVPTPEIYSLSRSSTRTIAILPLLFSTLLPTTLSFLLNKFV